jgi:selenocysteine-specific elongation factor
MPRSLILGTAGHIDHGKTALVRALTGIDTDRLPQEKQRGITIDIGFAHLELGDVHFGIVDVPGHERFIRNMLAGAAGIDLALLVVAADDSVMPQTREHLAILELLRIHHGVIAITKCDLAEPSWLDLVDDEIRTLVKGTFLDGAPIVRTSAQSGVGLDELKAALLEAATSSEEARRALPFRMAIDRSFTVRGVGTVVTGTVASGGVQVRGEAEWLPVQRTVKVRGVQSHDRDVEWASSSQRAAINLQNVHHTEIQRGHELAYPGYLIPSRRITVMLRALPDSPRVIRNRTRVRLHVGTQEVIATVRLLRGTALKPGGEVEAQLICDDPVMTVARQPLVIRDESPLRTIGGGRVLQPVASTIPRRDTSTIDRLRDLLDDDPRRRAETALILRGPRPWRQIDLYREADLGYLEEEDAVGEMIEELVVVSVGYAEYGGTLLHRETVADLTDRFLVALRELHDASPLMPGIPRSRLSARFEYLTQGILYGLIERLIKDGSIVGNEQSVALADFEPALSQAQRNQLARLIEAYRDAAFSPPDPSQLAKDLALAESEARALFELAVAAGDLVHIGGAVHLHREHHEELKWRVGVKLLDDEEMTIAELRDLLGTSRKHAVPICEHLDRIGLTKRKGDLRVLAADGPEFATLLAKKKRRIRNRFLADLDADRAAE